MLLIGPCSITYGYLNQISDMRILVIEDDEKIASFITKGLREEGFSVDVVFDGVEGMHFGLEETYNIIIVDIMLPGLDGFSVIKKLREKKIQTPIIILSAKHSVDDRVKGLQIGSDDYLVKPFSFSELLARIQALLRRSQQVVNPVILSVADLTLDLLSKKVTRGDNIIQLQAKEYSLLEYLLRNSGNIISKTLILENVYDYSFDPLTNVVDVLVCRLRNKIDKGYGKKLIHTIRGMGYVLKDKE